MTADDVRTKLVAILNQRYGRADEELMAAGVIDSLRAIDLAFELEQQFELPPNAFALADMRSVTSLVQRITSASESIAIA